MKEFVEKLIGMLEEELKSTRQIQTIQCKGNDGYGTPLQSKLSGEICALLKVKNIVNQLAEEYINCSTDTSTNTSSGWIPCSERLPEEKVYDDGYVEPSYAVLVFTKYGAYKVSRYWGNRRNKRDYYDWVDIDYQKNEVIAWMPLPPAYVPKEGRE